jgi:NitT/TauT family transport system substrate-binding protein
MTRLPKRAMRALARAVCGVLTAAVLAGASAQAQTPVRFLLDWRFEGPAAPFTLALDKGYFREEGLEVTIEPGSGSREPIQKLAAGASDMSLGDINTLIRFRDENPTVDLKAVMMLYDRPPFAIIGRRSRGITPEIQSFRRRRFGAPPLDAAFAQWPVFKAVNNIDEKEWAIRIDNVGLLVREPLLAQGEVDAIFGYSMSSYVTLQARGVPKDDLVLLLMSDYGLELYGNAILVSPKFLAEKPEAVRGFLRALIRGIRDAAADPRAAVDTILRRNDVARQEIEIERLTMTLREHILTPWVREHGIGDIDDARFARAIDQIALAYTFKRKPKPQDVFADRFLPPETERKIEEAGDRR